MSLSKYTSTRETTNTARLARLILGPCTDVLRDILKNDIPASDLSKEVKRWTDNLTKNKKRNFLNPSQLAIIFPSPTNQYRGDYSDLDISILYTIFRNVSKVPPPSKGWGEYPDPSDRSVAANIERIRILRNKYYGHSADISLSCSEFRQECRNIWDIVVELERNLGSSTVYQESVNEIKTCSMDPDLEQKYIDRLGAIDELYATVSKHSERLGILTKKLDMRTDPKIEKEIETTTFMVRSHHEEMANVFVKTRAYDRAKELVEKNGHIVIKGTPGAGKTTLAKWLLKAFMDCGKRPLQVFKMSKLYGRVSPVDNLAIFLDNVFGEFSFSVNDFTKFVNMKDSIESLLKSNTRKMGNVLILTIRNDIYMEIVVKQKRDSLLHSSVIDLSWGDYALEAEEIAMFFNNYNLPGSIKEDLKLRQAESYLALGFPQCCRLAHENPDFRNDVSSFLSSPAHFLQDYMKKLIAQRAEKIAVLVYILLKGGSVESSLLSVHKDQDMKVIALKMLKLNLQSFAAFQECVKFFEGFLTIYDKINDVYTFSHSSVQEVLFNVLIAVFPEEIIQNCHHVCLQKLTRENLKCIQTLDDKKVFKVVASRITLILRNGSPDGYESISLLKLWNDRGFYAYILANKVCSNHVQECVDSKGNTLMVHFAKSGHINWIKHLIKNNFDETQKYRSLNAACRENHVNIVDAILSVGVKSDLSTCFHAVQSGNLDLLLKISKLVDINQTSLSLVSELTDICHSLIQEVCLSRQFHLVQPLLEQYPTLIDIRSIDGETVLHYASLCGDYNVCKYLVINYPQLLYRRNDEGCTSLHTASIGGGRELISFLIEKGMDINALTNTGANVLHIACCSANYEACSFIVTNYPELIKIRDNNGNTVLHEACASGDKKLISFLIAKGVDVNSLTNDRKSVLHIACSNGKYDACKYIVTNYPKLTEVKDNLGYTALHYACRSGDRKLISFLTKKGLDVNATTNDGESVLHIACGKGKYDACKYIVTNYPQLKDVKNNDGFTALHYASINGDKKLICFLLKKGLDINALSKTGVSVLHIACNNGKYDACENFVTNYPNLVDVKNNDGFTALHYASINGDKKIVSLLIAKGLDINAQSNDGQSVLHIACRNGKYDVCEYFVNNYPQLMEVRDSEGYTALHYASGCGKRKLICFLTKKGMDITAKTYNGQSVLHIACRNGKYDACEYFVTNYPQFIKVRDNDKYTALHSACISGDMKLIALLIAKGLDVNSRTNDRKSVLHIACSNGNYDACQYFVTNFQQLIGMKDINGYTALHDACISGDKKLISFLVAKGLNVDDRTKTGESVLHIACLKAKYTAIKYFVNNFPQLIDVKNDEGFTALHVASVNDDRKLISFLIENGFDFKAMTDTGKSVLHIACGNGNFDACEYYVNNYPQLMDVKDNNGYSPLHSACVSGDKKLIPFLTDKGLDINALTSTGENVLHIARKYGFPNLCEYLIDNYPQLHAHCSRKQERLKCFIL